MVLFLVVLALVGVGGVRLALDDDDDWYDNGALVDEEETGDVRAAVIQRMNNLPKPSYLILKSGLRGDGSLIFELPPDLKAAAEKAAEEVAAVESASSEVSDARSTLSSNPNRLPFALRTSDTQESTQSIVDQNSNAFFQPMTMSFNFELIDHWRTDRTRTTGWGGGNVEEARIPGTSTIDDTASEQYVQSIDEPVQASESTSVRTSIFSALGWEDAAQHNNGYHEEDIEINEAALDTHQQRRQQLQLQQRLHHRQTEYNENLPQSSVGGAIIQLRGLDCIVDSFSGVLHNEIGRHIYCLNNNERAADENESASVNNGDCDDGDGHDQDDDKEKKEKKQERDMEEEVEVEKPDDESVLSKSATARDFHQRRAARMAEDEEEASLCTLCCARKHEAVFLTCGHGGVCFDCAIDTYLRSRERCPFCRRRVGQIVTIGAIEAMHKVKNDSGILVHFDGRGSQPGTLNSLATFFDLPSASSSTEISLHTSASALADRYSFGARSEVDNESANICQGEVIFAAPVIGPTRSVFADFHEMTLFDERPFFF